MRLCFPNILIAKKILGCVRYYSWVMALAVLTGFVYPVFSQPHTGIWDGTWTDGNSGIEGNLVDEKNSDGKSGLKDSDQPYKFYIPPETRKYSEVDPDELWDFRHGDYSPYAMVQLYRDLRYHGKVIPKGYYTLKIDTAQGGSQDVKLPPEEMAKVPPIAIEDLQEPKHVGLFRKKLNPKWLRSLILKRNGKVVAVFPITMEMEYHRQKGEPRIRKPIAYVVYDPIRPPVLRYNTGKVLYEAQIEAEQPIEFPLQRQQQTQNPPPARLSPAPSNN